MSYKTKLKLKLVLYNLLGLITIAVILFIAYLNEKLIETSITMVLFYIYRNLFEKQYHASSLYLCSIVSITVFTILIKLELDITVSVLYSVTLTFIVTLISYYVKNYFDKSALVIKYKKRLDDLNTKCLENLTKEEFMQTLNKFNTDVLILIYNYLHRPRSITACEFAYTNGISESALFKNLKKIKEYYDTLGNS